MSDNTMPAEVERVAETVREAIAQHFDDAAKRIHEMRHASPFHSVSHDALTTYAVNLSGWAREIRYMNLAALTQKDISR